MEVYDKIPAERMNGIKSIGFSLEDGSIYRKEKSVTRATVMRAFHRARVIQESEGCVSGPKKLGTFGASYLYPVFLRIGVCSKKSEIF